MAGAPTRPMDMVQETNLAVGTAVHSLCETLFRGTPTMLEVKLGDWLPDGWQGTADWITWHPEYRCFVLGDLKTSKPGAIHWIEKGGAKSSHIWQVSAYWHALHAMGLPLLNAAYVYYLPKNQLLAREGAPVRPTMQEIIPLPAEVVHERMASRKAEVDAYLATVPVGPSHARGGGRSHVQKGALDMADYLTPELAPVIDRDLNMRINKQLKRPVIDVVYEPNWSVEFCEFDEPLCTCHQQGTNKVGSWDRDEAGCLVYKPSATQPQPDVLPQPAPALVAALVAAQKEKA